MTQGRILWPQNGLLNPRSGPISLDIRSLLKIRLLSIAIYQAAHLLPYSHQQYLKTLSLISHVPGIAITKLVRNTCPLNSPCLVSSLQDRWPSISSSQFLSLQALCFFFSFILPSLSTGPSRNAVP